MKWILLSVFLLGSAVYVEQSYAGPTTATKDDYCFYGMSGTIEKPTAVMSFKTGSMLIAENGKTETWEHGGSVGTGMNGGVFYQGDHPEALYSTSICMDANTDPPSEPTILIFRDRVFWPCDHDWRPKPSKSRRRHHENDQRQCYDTEDGRNPVYSTTDPEPNKPRMPDEPAPKYQLICSMIDDANPATPLAATDCDTIFDTKQSCAKGAIRVKAIARNRKRVVYPVCIFAQGTFAQISPEKGPD